MSFDNDSLAFDLIFDLRFTASRAQLVAVKIDILSPEYYAAIGSKFELFVLDGVVTDDSESGTRRNHRDVFHA
jgi:hypothetical protein